MIYLDHNATTPLLPEVREAMLPWLGEHYGNPSSVHRAGRLARQALESARVQVAELVGAQAEEVIFTSGGTEANALALEGYLEAAGGGLLVASTEHAAVRDAADRLARRGTAVHEIAVDAAGLIQADELRVALTQYRPSLVSIMWANNETGVVQDLATLGEIIREAGVRLHSDGVQAAGKLPVDFAAVDLLTLSAHKINGPKGVGALVRRREIALAARQPGGGQEQGLRGGTENLAGIVGFGVAAAAARRELAVRDAQWRALRDELEQGLAALPGVQIHGRDAARVGNTCQFTVDGFESEALLMALDRAGFAVSSGSACHAGSGEPTHVLRAMGVPRERAFGAVRVSLGHGNDAADIRRFLAELGRIVSAQADRFAAGLFA